MATISRMPMFCMESWKTLEVPWKAPVMVAERDAGLEGERNGDGRQLTGVRDALRTGIGNQLGNGAQGDHVAVIALHVDEVEPVGVLLVAGQHFQEHAVLIGGRVDGGRELRAEGVVEGAGDGLAGSFA